MNDQTYQVTVLIPAPAQKPMGAGFSDGSLHIAFHDLDSLLKWVSENKTKITLIEGSLRVITKKA